MLPAKQEEKSRLNFTSKSNKLGQNNCALRVNHISLVLGEDSGHQQTFELRPTNPEVEFSLMQRSKHNEADLGKEQPPRQQDSDGSGSVVSLQSSSSDDVKYPGIRGRDLHSEGAGVPAFQVEPVQKSNDDATRQNMGKLQQKLHTQPTHNTLDEIISTLKNQNGMNDSSIPGMSLPLHNDSTVGGKTYPSMQSYTSGGGWNSSPLQMR